MKPTIKDVARLAGVSFKTVSRVINNEGVVGEALQAKVWAAIKELNYHPNLSARGLRGAVSSIGFLYDNPNSNYVIAMQNGILGACLKEGYELMVRPCQSEADDIADQIITMIDRTRIGGIVLTPPISDNPQVLAVLKSKGVEAVRILSGTEPPEDAELFPCIYVNDHKAAFDITEHLIELGHKNIAFLAGEETHKSSWERQAGFIQALESHGLKVNNKLVLPGRFSFDSGMERTQALLKQQFDSGDGPNSLTAIFAANDEIAAGALFAARLSNISVPEQLSIAGFEDSPFSRQTWPKLTTAAQPAEVMAERATTLLIQKIRAKQGDTIVTSEPFVPSLVVRDSTCSPRSTPKKHSAQLPTQTQK